MFSSPIIQSTFCKVKKQVSIFFSNKKKTLMSERFGLNLEIRLKTIENTAK